LIELADKLHKLSEHEQVAVAARIKWLAGAHKYQVPPPLEVDYTVWMMLAGRGAGKTRSAAEALWWWAWTHPESRCLVLAPTSNDVKFTCMEGQSGLLSVIPQALIKDYNKQDHQIILTNGSSIRGISGDSYERLRGPQFHFAWCCLGGTGILLPDGSEKPIEQVSIGDVVQTRHGPRKVLAAGVSGNTNELATITVGSTRLTTTIDHPILIDNRWVNAGDIKIGDRVWIRSNTTESLGTKDQAVISTISAEGICTDTSGSKPTEAFLADTSYITKITMPKTIGSRIWNACLRTSTWFTTLLGAPHRMLRRALRQQECGIGGVPDHSSPASANSVATSLNPEPLHQERSALQNVQSDGAPMHSFQRCESVSGVVLNTPQSSEFNDIAASPADAKPLERFQPEFQMAEVVSVERSPNQTTYNLTVEGEHEFVANGIVVHNCDELAAFQYLRDAWDMMMFGLRLGEQPRVIVTTTPKPKDLILELVDREDCIVDRASTYENIKNLAPSFAQQLEQYKGTKLYEQEVLGQIVDLEDGKVVSRDMFRLWPAGKPFPKFEFIVQSYDCAFSEKTHNDPTACTTWGVFKPLDGPMSVLLIDCWAEHLSFPNLKPKVIEEFRVSYGEGKDAKKPDLILVEDKAAGISLIQELQKAHLPVRSYNPGRADKMQRLQIAAAIFAAGRVWLPESQNRKGFVRDWCEGFLSQICSFPDSEHDDYVDSASQAVRLLKDMGFLDIDPEPRYDDDDLVDAKPAKVNPYAI